jgi:hypothetical protein
LYYWQMGFNSVFKGLILADAWDVTANDKDDIYTGM